jgi:hypothetical protein
MSGGERGRQGLRLTRNLECPPQNMVGIRVDPSVTSIPARAFQAQDKICW